MTRFMTQSDPSHRFFVVTGGPGAGKTSLVDALGAAGFRRSVEVGRAIIQDQVATGGRALPWDDRLLFAELMLSWELRSWREAQLEPGIAIFDRGVPDILGYLRLIGEAPPRHVVEAAEAFRYNARVFIAPPWREIFTQDTERKQDFAEAVRTHEALARAYVDCGYELVELPRVPVAERVAFVTDEIAACLSIGKIGGEEPT
jgi:predicted ATPase